jgi:putative ATPase
VRDRIFSLAQPQRHNLVLDLNAGTGLLTWEAVRQVPEGGVYACVRTSTDANALREQAAALPEPTRPIILTASITELTVVLASQAANVQFDLIIGRNVLLSEPDKAIAAQILAKLMPRLGKLILAETVPRHTQRFYRLLKEQKLDTQLYERLVVAEEAIYADQSDPMINWDVKDLHNAFASTGLTVEVVIERNLTPMHISSSFLRRLFTANTNRPSYADRLAQNLTQEEIHTLQDLFTRYLLNQSVSWESTVAFLKVST